MLNLEQLLRIPHVDNDLRFSISHDEKEIVFSWNKSGKWELWKIENSEINELPNNLLGSKFSPCHLPNEKYLAYAIDFDGSESYHIILHNLKNDSIIDITLNSGYAQQPNFDFSPDGKTL